jgi:Flp pilus assembly protein TadG
MTPHTGGAGNLGILARGRCDRGSVTLELAILTPALLMLIGLVVVAGRIEVASAAVDQASAAAAREASLARTPSAARAAATRAATANLAAQNLHCTDVRVTVDTAGFAVPVGTPAQVTARVTCTLSTGDLSVPGMPGTRTITASSQSSLDTYRGRA